MSSEIIYTVKPQLENEQIMNHKIALKYMSGKLCNFCCTKQYFSYNKSEGNKTDIIVVFFSKQSWKTALVERVYIQIFITIFMLPVERCALNLYSTGALI